MSLPIGALSVEGVFRLDAEGHVIRSPALEKLVNAARVAEKTLQLAETTAETEIGRRVSRAAIGLLGEALRQVDAEACALVEAEVGAQPLANKEGFPFVEHGLETPKPGGEPPGSDVTSALPTPGLSVTSESEK